MTGPKETILRMSPRDHEVTAAQLQASIAGSELHESAQTVLAAVRTELLWAITKRLSEGKGRA